MPYPFGRLPTLREFLAVAVALGCEVMQVPGLIGPDGPMDARCLIGPAPNRIPYPLPGMRDDDRMTPTLIGSIERTLDINTGFPSI
jgi:hypothetical protein